MKPSILAKVDGQMDEGDFYGTVVKNATYSLVIMIAIAIHCYVIIFYTGYALSAIYAAIIGLFYRATTTIFSISLIVTTVTFFYIFKPKNALTYLMWFLISVVYSGIMYLFGESIIIMVVALGILVTVAFLFGEVSFTGILTYRDLKEWVDKKSDDVPK